MLIKQEGAENFTTYTASAPAFYAEGQVQWNAALEIWEAYYSGMEADRDRDFKTKEAGEFWILALFNKEIKEWRESVVNSSTYKSNPAMYAPFLN